MNREKAAALAAELDAAIARKSLLDFSARMYPGFMAPPHLRMLADILERVERGELQRVIVSLHPGSGKSTLLQLFAGWYLGRDPKRKIIATSAAERLVVRNSRAVRNLFGEPEWPFDAKLAADASAAGLWETVEGGGLFSVGVGGVVTGWRGNLIVADDLEDGQSTKLELDNLEDWFRGKLTTRAEPNAPIVIVQTRWPNDDLPKRLMSGPRGKQWTYIRMPALAEEDDPLGRKPGEALWPERFDVADLQAIREDVGPRHFQAQYQGAPMSDGGNILRSEWFGRYDELPKNLRIIAALDAAAKTGVSNDFSVIVVIGVSDNAYFVIDVIRRRVEYPELLRMTKAAYEKHDPSHIYVEDTSNAIALIQQLQEESMLPIIPVKPLGSKLSRVEGISGKVEAGKVYLPRSAPWLAEFETELCEFPAVDHDDQTDAFAMAISQDDGDRVTLFGYYGLEYDFRPAPTHNEWGRYLGNLPRWKTITEGNSNG